MMIAIVIWQQNIGTIQNSKRLMVVRMEMNPLFPIESRFLKHDQWWPGIVRERCMIDASSIEDSHECYLIIQIFLLYRSTAKTTSEGMIHPSWIYKFWEDVRKDSRGQICTPGKCRSRVNDNTSVLCSWRESVVCIVKQDLNTYNLAKSYNAASIACIECSSLLIPTDPIIYL